jgi:hypothetical protein
MLSIRCFAMSRNISPPFYTTHSYFTLWTPLDLNDQRCLIHVTANSILQSWLVRLALLLALLLYLKWQWCIFHESGCIQFHPNMKSMYVRSFFHLRVLLNAEIRKDVPVCIGFSLLNTRGQLDERRDTHF